MAVVKQVFFGCIIVRHIDFLLFGIFIRKQCHAVLCRGTKNKEPGKSNNEIKVKMNSVHLLLTFSMRAISLMLTHNREKKIFFQRSVLLRKTKRNGVTFNIRTVKKRNLYRAVGASGTHEKTARHCTLAPQQTLGDSMSCEEPNFPSVPLPLGPKFPS